jgi:hypothetical protein
LMFLLLMGSARSGSHEPSVAVFFHVRMFGWLSSFGSRPPFHPSD